MLTVLVGGLVDDVVLGGCDLRDGVAAVAAGAPFACAARTAAAAAAACVACCCATATASLPWISDCLRARAAVVRAARRRARPRSAALHWSSVASWLVVA